MTPLRDPRAESDPPPDDARPSKEPNESGLVPAGATAENVPRSAREASSPIAKLLAEEMLAKPKSLPPPPLKTTVTSMDPRLEESVKALETGDWKALSKQLGPLDKSGGLPPTLGLLNALAHHESSGEESTQAANELAIRCMASLFGVPIDSPIALVLAKRLLRKNPTAWRERPAPPAKTSLLIIAVTLAVGSGIGWLLTSHVGRLFKLHF
jgi:hypothetical protein